MFFTDIFVSNLVATFHFIGSTPRYVQLSHAFRSIIRVFQFFSAGTNAGQICLFSVAVSASGVTVTLNAQINAHSCAIYSMESSGEWLATGDENGGVRLWQLMGDKLVAKGTLSDSADPSNCWPVNAVLFHDNAASVFVAYGSGMIRIFDTRTCKIQIEVSN